jgi:hypothetical protein
LDDEKEASAVGQTVAGFSLLAPKSVAAPQTGFKLRERIWGELVSLGRSDLLEFD